MKFFQSKINIIISGIMVAVFIFLTGINFVFYSKIIDEDTKNIAKLTSSNIYSEIQNDIIKPVVVSLTMANDSFFIDWTKNEPAERQDITKYLNGIKSKYGYDAAFYVSEETNTYYTENGILKTVSKEDQLDAWYYNFITSPELYELNVDIDEDENFDLTVFVNCKVLNDDGELIGVIGVGLKVKKIQSLLLQFQQDYDITPYIIDENGVIQVHPNRNLIESDEPFTSGHLSTYKDSIVNEKNDMQIFKPSISKEDMLIITKYMEELDWYLIVEKESVIRKSFYKIIINNFLTVSCAYLLLLFVMNYVIKAYEKRLTDIANTDPLTKIANRRMFDQKLVSHYKKSESSNLPLSLAIFDIDNFKEINDTYGHVFTDEILKNIATQSKGYFEKFGDELFRTGGDEFAVLLYGNEQENITCLTDFIDLFNHQENIKKYDITISMGITHYTNDLTDPMQMMKKADLAMYESKNRGKNTYTISSES